MCNEAVPAPEAVLAGIDLRLSKMERMIGAALDAASRPGAVYMGLLEAAGELSNWRLATDGMKVLFGAGRASVLAEQAAEAEAAREPCPVVRLSG